MNRISHLKLRKRLEDTKSKITNKKFFTSPLFRGYLADMAETSGNRYKKPIKVVLEWNAKSEFIACTNGDIIHINTANPIVKRLPTRELKMICLTGLLAHEVGHILFTDFDGLDEYLTAIESGKFWPAEPAPNTMEEDEALNEITIEVFQSSDEAHMKRALAVISSVAGSILNVLEDIYIETQMANKFPGSYKTSIELVQEEFLAGMPTLAEDIDTLDDGKTTSLSIAFSLILQYARGGDFNNPEGIENEYTDTLNRCLDYIDTSVYASDVNERYNAANLITLILWPFIKQVLKEIEDQDNESGSSGSGGGSGSSSDDESKSNADTALDDLLEQLAQIAKHFSASSQPQGSNTPINKDNTSGLPQKRGSTDPAVGDSNTGHQQSKTKPGGTDVNNVGIKPNSKGGNTSPGTVSNDDGDDGADALTSEIAGVAENNDDEDTVQDVLEEEAGRIPLTETEDFETHGDGTISYDKEYQGSGYNSAASDVERLLENMAQDMLAATFEKELHKELQDMAADIHYGDAHQGVDIQIRRMSVVDEDLVQQYNQISPELIKLSRRLQKEVSQILADKRDGGKLTGLIYGKRFSARDAIRNDGRVFYNSRLPQEPMEMAVAVLVDESGSMSGKDRATSARAASIVLYDFCRGLNIPIAIYGHTEFNTGVNIYAHAEFGTMDNNDRYRLMDISSRSGNRDGAALRFTAERLVRRPEPLKLLILISDGQPAGYGSYYGTAAEEDLRGIKNEYKRKDVQLFAAAIGDDKENIQRIYGDGFLDITDLNKLPVNLCGLLQRYVMTL